MLRSTSLLLLLVLAACGEEQEEFYDSFADAQRAGAVKRGWIPAFVPASARNIRERHDIDTNIQILRFTVDPSDIPEMLANLKPAPTEDLHKISELRRKFDIDGQVSAYMACSRPLNGMLLINRKGEAAYTTSVDWGNDSC